jgi:hypothetical protein
MSWVNATASCDTFFLARYRNTLPCSYAPSSCEPEPNSLEALRERDGLRWNTAPHWLWRSAFVTRRDRSTLQDRALSNTSGRLCGPERAKLLLQLYLLQERVGEQFAKSNILALQVLECIDLLSGRQCGKGGCVDF